jgi:hypothetical protein
MRTLSEIAIAMERLVSVKDADEQLWDSAKLLVEALEKFDAPSEFPYPFEHSAVFRICTAFKHMAGIKE